jgi:glycosyltransferase involved in cell wall biosynthesis
VNVLVACYHYPVASGRYIARALKRMGHDVRTVGPAMLNQIWAMKVDERYTWTPDLELPLTGEFVADVLPRLLPEGWRPDLVITADSAFTLLGPSPCPHVLWGVDNHVRDYQLGALWDALFLAHSWGARMGEPNAHWLPAAYDPAAHYVEAGTERDLDVGIAAVAYPERVELVQRLADSGLSVAAVTGAIWDDYRRFYNRVKVALVKSIAGDLTQRFLEAMAMGCCVLADRTLDADKLGFLPGVDYWPYETPDEAAREAEYLLGGDRWATIADNGRRKVQSGHSWDHRALEMLEKTFHPIRAKGA